MGKKSAADSGKTPKPAKAAKVGKTVKAVKVAKPASKAVSKKVATPQPKAVAVKPESNGAVVTYHREIELPVPADVRQVQLSVEVVPPSASCLIYGQLLNGNWGCVQVHGPKQEVVMPICQPKIYVRALSGATSLKVKTKGWQGKDGRVVQPS